MKRIAKRSPQGSSPSGGKLRLTILLATVAAFLLVPAAQAFAKGGTAHVTIAGSGSGEVTTKGGAAAIEGLEELGTLGEGVPPIECHGKAPGEGVCENDNESGEFAEHFAALRAIADPGSEFTGWTFQEEGFDALEGPCSLPEAGFCLAEGNGFGGHEARIEVIATFTSAGPAGPPLTLKIEEGQGTVVSNPAGLECTGTAPHECTTESIAEGTVTLTASPAAGYAFSSWSGCLTHNGLTCTVSLTAAKTVKVKFLPTPSLTVEKAGSGAGKVSATGISCDESCSVASAAVKKGAAVTVKVTPAKGSEAAIFESPTGSATALNCPAAGPCSFTINENSSVKVKFNPIPTHTMTVNLTGPAAYKGKVKGKGAVKGLLGAAVSCGSGCTTTTESFFATDTVKLEASAATGYAFKGWTVSGGSAGTCTGETTPCEVATNANKTVSAEFK